MSQTLDNQLITVSIQNTINNPQALQAPVSAVMSLPTSYSWSSGNGLGQADRVYATQVNIAASGNTSITLTGAVTDAVGTTFTIARVKALYVAAAVGNTNNVIVGGAGANGWISWVGAAAHTVTVRPGGALLLTAPDATAYTVTPATANILQLANSGAGTAVIANVIIIGSSV